MLITKNVNTALLPIDFVKLIPEDFTNYDYKVKGNQTYTLNLEDSGYIGDSLKNAVDLEETNTVVVNAGVGLGKSNSCARIVLDYLRARDENGKPKYTIFFSAPFKSILTQYLSIFIEEMGVNEKDVFNYENLTNENYKKVSEFPLHLITTNSLLGNYGDEAFIQKFIKTEYLKSVINFSERNNRKVVIVFDEIHDCIANFEQKFIFNLWKWKYVIHKIFVLSATFSQGSKVVLRYLADLTNDELHLTETNRLAVQEKQANLHICINDSYKYTGNDDILFGLIESEIDRNRNIQILCFSEKLSKEIADGIVTGINKKEETKISKLLKAKFGGVNLCTSKTNSKFDEDYCNVGTTFKTGINITRSNTSFIVIMPDKIAYDDIYSRRLGIFTDGRNSVIQSIARLRNISDNDIFLVMPSPKCIISNPSNTTGENNYLNYINQIPLLKRLNHNDLLLKHHSCNSQEKLINQFFSRYKASFFEGFQNYNNIPINLNISRSDKKPRMSFPDFQEYIMEDGDRYLASKYEIFGSNISSYVIWAAFNNQFENSKLKSVRYVDTIFLENGNILMGLFIIYQKYFESAYDSDYISEKKTFDILCKLINETLIVKVRYKQEDGTYKYKNAKDDKQVQILLISLVKVLKRGDENFIKKIFPRGIRNIIGGLNRAVDYSITKEMYIQSAISTSINHLVQYQIGLSESEKSLVKLYSKFYSLISIYKANSMFCTTRGTKYLPSKQKILSLDLFTKTYKLEFIELVKKIRVNDLILKDDVFSFCQWADKIIISEIRNDDSLLNNYFGRIIEELKYICFKITLTTTKESASLINVNGITTSYKGKIYKVVNEIDFDNINGINLLYNSSSVSVESSVSEQFLQEGNNAQFIEGIF